jgi:hypothetical protein
MSEGLCECGCGRVPPIARRSRPHLGHVKGQPVPFCQGHGNTLRRIGLDRYAEMDLGYKTPCWAWTGPLTAGTGYGYANINSRRVGSHRAMYEHHKGLIPDGLELDHLCRVRHCVNPEHLEPVTRRENVRRGKRTKLTAGIVRTIRRSSESKQVLAAEFGVAVHQIYCVQTYRAWRDIV